MRLYYHFIPSHGNQALPPEQGLIMWFLNGTTGRINGRMWKAFNRFGLEVI